MFEGTFPLDEARINHALFVLFEIGRLRCICGQHRRPNFIKKKIEMYTFQMLEGIFSLFKIHPIISE